MRRCFDKPSVVSYKRHKNIRDLLVRAKLPPKRGPRRIINGFKNCGELCKLCTISPTGLTPPDKTKASGTCTFSNFIRLELSPSQKFCDRFFEHGFCDNLTGHGKAPSNDMSLDIQLLAEPTLSNNPVKNSEISYPEGFRNPCHHPGGVDSTHASA